MAWEFRMPATIIRANNAAMVPGTGGLAGLGYVHAERSAGDSVQLHRVGLKCACAHVPNLAHCLVASRFI